MFIPLSVVLPLCRVITANNMVHVQLHTLLIRTSGKAPNHRRSSFLLYHLPIISCPSEDHHHNFFQWPREALLPKCLIPPFPPSTLSSKVSLQACPHLLLLMDRIFHQDLGVPHHHHLTSLQTEVLLHLSLGHPIVTLKTDSLLRPTFKGPGVPRHLSMVNNGLNPQWGTNLEALQNIITEKTLTLSNQTWSRIQTLYIFIKTVRVPRQVQPTGVRHIISMRTEEVHPPLAR